MEKKRDGFSSNLGAVLATLGSCLGLGNIIFFPGKIINSQAGAIFIISYIIFLFLVAIPVLIGELTIGRHSQKNAVNAYETLGHNKGFGALGWLVSVVAIFLMGYYTVLAGWVFRYAGFSVIGGLRDVSTTKEAGALFGSFLGSPEPLIWQIIFIVIIGIVLSFGIKKGIERAVKILMPVLVIILVVIFIRGVTLSGAGSAFSWLFIPKAETLTLSKILPVVVLTVGLGLFKLSLGIGTMVTYGSYTKREVNIYSNAVKIALIDLIVTLVAGFSIYSGFFTGGGKIGENSAGFGLLFVSVPALFRTIPLGNIIMALFFILTTLVAFTAAISIFEVPITVIYEKTKLGRKTSVWIVAGIVLLIGIFPALSDSVFSSLGQLSVTFGLITQDGLISITDHLISNVFMPISGIVVMIIIAFRAKKDELENELSGGGVLKNNKLTDFYKKLSVVSLILLIFVLAESSFGLISLLLSKIFA